MIKINTDTLDLFREDSDWGYITKGVQTTLLQFIDKGAILLYVDSENFQYTSEVELEFADDMFNFEIDKSTFEQIRTIVSEKLNTYIKKEKTTIIKMLVPSDLDGYDYLVEYVHNRDVLGTDDTREYICFISFAKFNIKDIYRTGNGKFHYDTIPSEKISDNV